MPRVAIADNVVSLANPTQAKFQAADNAGGVGGAIADGLVGLGKAGAAHAEQEQKNQIVYNEAAAKDGYNAADKKIRELLYTGDNAYFSLKGAAAIDGKKPVVDQLAKIRADTLANFKNDQQKRMFGQAFDAMTGPELEKVSTYSNRELTSYGTLQSQSRQAGAADNAVLNADDEGRFGAFLNTGRNEITAEGNLNGWGKDVIAERQREYTSGIRARVTGEKMIADPVGAKAYYDAHKDDFLPADRIKMESALYGPLMERQSAADVDGLMGESSGALVPGATVPTPGAGGTASLSRMQAITANTESRNRDRNANGSIVTSPAGAQGRMQVMPGTNRDPGFGVRPAADDSDEERARVGRDYLAAMMKRYGNDPAKAWAAYNGGPRRVDNAVKAKGAAWLSAMPQETRDYVATNTAALGPRAAGDQSGAAPARDDLGALYARIDAQPWDYERKKLAREEVDRRVQRDDRLRNRAEDAAKDQAYDAIGRLGDSFTSLNQLPAEVRNGLSPEVRLSLQAQAESNARPKAVAANGPVAMQLDDLAATDPDGFVNKDLRPLAPYMTPDEYARLHLQQTKMLTKPAERTDYRTVWSAVGRYGADAGLDMAPKRSGEDDGKFKQRRADGYAVFKIMRSILDTVTESKRQPTEQEVKTAFDQAVVNTVVTTPGWFGNNSEAVPRYRNPNMSPTALSIPQPEKDKIVAALKAAGQPTDDGTIARIYFARQSKNN